DRRARAPRGRPADPAQRVLRRGRVLARDGAADTDEGARGRGKSHGTLGALVPKGVALSYSERVALGVSAPVRLFFFVFKPLIWVLQRSSEAAQRAIGIDPKAMEGEAH